MSTKDLAKIILIGIGCILVIGLIIIIKDYPPNGVLICNMESAPGDIQASYTYTIEFKQWKVTSFSSEERITSTDKDFLKTYEKSLKEESSYLEISTMLKNNELVVKTIIDYEKLGETINKTNSNLKINDLKKAYSKSGATCYYK